MIIYKKYGRALSAWIVYLTLPLIVFITCSFGWIKDKFFNKRKKIGWTEKEVKRYFGERLWKKFDKWITAQTCPVNSRGDCNFYEHDVIRFVDMILEHKPTYFD